jgi:LmbE family N-acetylglucosaminyl deacetylase
VNALSGRTVVAVFAHPDDESIACGGTLARLAEEGAHVVLLCASRGERGSADRPDVNALIAQARAKELIDAATILGIAEVLLFDHPDGNLRWAHVSELHAQITMTLRHYRPDAVITFGEDGLYWHLDHIGVHERTTTACANLGPDAPALYYVTMPPGMMRAVVDAASTHGWRPPQFGFWSLTPDAFGDCAVAADLVIGVEQWVPRKLGAIACHASQMAAGHPFANLDPAQARQWLGVEHFRRSPVGASRDGVLELLAIAPQSSMNLQS